MQTNTKGTDLRLELPASALPDGVGELALAATLWAPAAVDVDDACVLVCWPGGSYGRHYWNIQLPGRDGYSFVEHMTTQGYVVVGADPLGVGDSGRPEDGTLCTYDALAAMGAEAEALDGVDLAIDVLALDRLARLSIVGDPGRRKLLGAKLVAYLGGVGDTRAVHQWAEGVRTPNDAVQQRLRFALRVALPIAQADSAAIAQAWFQGLNPQLDDRAPARMLRDGDLDEVGPAFVAAERLPRRRVTPELRTVVPSGPLYRVGRAPDVGASAVDLGRTRRARSDKIDARGNFIAAS